MECGGNQGMLTNRQAAWNGERRKVDVMLILDRSGSMDDLIGGTSKL